MKLLQHTKFNHFIVHTAIQNDINIKDFDLLKLEENKNTDLYVDVS